MTSTSPFRHAFIAACALALAPAFAPVAYAEKADREKPITFTSDDGEVNYEKRTGVLKGNVVITQGTLTIKANRIDFKQNADNSLSATVLGSPLAFRQKRDDAEGYYEGWAQRAEYDGQKEQLELFDNAILKRGADEIRSNYISYNAATELFKAEGRPSTAPAAAGAGGPPGFCGSKPARLSMASNVVLSMAFTYASSAVTSFLVTSSISASLSVTMPTALPTCIIDGI